MNSGFSFFFLVAVLSYAKVSNLPSHKWTFVNGNDHHLNLGTNVFPKMLNYPHSRQVHLSVITLWPLVKHITRFFFFFLWWQEWAALPIKWALCPNSPNLHPIECLWDVLDIKVQSMEDPHCNLQDFKDLLLRSWCWIKQHTFRGLMEPMPQRVRTVVAPKGGPTPHSVLQTLSLCSITMLRYILRHVSFL